MTRQQLPNTSSSSLPRASSIETTSFRLSNESKYSHNPTSANNGGHYYPNQIPTAATATTPSIHQRFLEDCASTTNYSSTTAGTSENLPLSLQNNHLQQSITSSSSTALLSSHHHHHHNREESTSSSSVVACDNHNRIQADNKKQQHPKKLQRITSKTHRYQSLTSALNPSIINPLPSSPKQHQAGYYSSSGTRQSYNSNYSFDINGSPYSRSNSNASTAAAATGSGPVNMSTKGIIPTTNTNSNSPSNTNDGNTTTSTPYPPPAPTVAGGGVTSATSMAFTATSPGFSGRSPISAHAVNHRRTFSTTADGSRNSAGGGQHQSDGGDPFWYIYKRNGKRKRMYQVYHPNYGWHPFGGRSHTGRKPIPFITGVVLIILPTVGFCIVVAPYIWHNFSIAPIIILIYMFLVSMSSMFMASFSDPGIIPRNLDAVYDPDTFAITPRPYNQPQSQTTGIPGAQGSSSLQGAAGGATSPSVDSQENVNNTDRFKNMTSEDVDKLLSDYVSLPPPYIELETPSQSSSNLYTKASPVRIVTVNGVAIRLKYCYTCRNYRPPRSSHCHICDNCVEEEDHHCLWLNNCVGRRNYRYFFTFILSTTIMGLYVAAFSLYRLIDPTRRPGPTRTLSNGFTFTESPPRIIDVIRNDPIALVLVIYSLMFSLTLGGLTGYHVVLISRNLTTHEQLTSKQPNRCSTTVNPFSQNNCLLNWVDMLCKPLPPTNIAWRGRIDPPPASLPPKFRDRRAQMHLHSQYRNSGHSHGRSSVSSRISKRFHSFFGEPTSPFGGNHHHQQQQRYINQHNQPVSSSSVIGGASSSNGRE